MKFNRDVLPDIELKPLQHQCLDWIEDNWNCPVLGLNLPTGIGKSFIIKTIQNNLPNTLIITANNILVKQYQNDFPNLNILTGKEHYTYEEEYTDAIIRARRGEPTLCNPVSYWYQRKNFKHITTIVVDEADEVLGMLHELASSQSALPDSLQKSINSTFNLEKWLIAKIANETGELEKAERTRHKTGITDIYLKRKQAGLRRWVKLHSLVRMESTEYGWSVKSKKLENGRLNYYLHLKPTILPKQFAYNFFNQSKLIMFSATLFPMDVEELSGSSIYKYLDMPSSIDKTRRPILLGNTLDTDLSNGFSTQELANGLDNYINDLQVGGSGLIHVTYSLNKELSDYWEHKGRHLHDKDNKQHVLRNYIKDGGVAIFSGMSTGINLKDDLARWNIISKLQYPNLVDVWVKKRMSLPDGKKWYELQTLRHIIQASGRTTRTENDWSVTIIADKRIHKLILNNLDKLPQSFKDSLIWNKIKNLKDYIETAKVNFENNR
jgi:hypothetical protein